MDKLEEAKYNIGRFLLPALFLLGGLYLMKIALIPTVKELNDGTTVEVPQPDVFLYASLLFVLGSVVWILYITGLIKKTIGYGVMVVMLIIGISILYYNYDTVKTVVNNKQDFEDRDVEIKQRMTDLKLAQQAYKEVNGVYTNDINALIDFLKNGKKLVIKKSGAVPERKLTRPESQYLYNDNRPLDNLMSEREAALLALSPFAATDTTGLKEFVRDTSYVPVIEAVFEEAVYLDKRNKLGVFPFSADSLQYIPYTKDPVRLDTGSVIRNEVRVPTVEIEMVHPMDTSIHYIVGDKMDNHLRESWIKG